MPIYLVNGMLLTAGIGTLAAGENCCCGDGQQLVACCSGRDDANCSVTTRQRCGELGGTELGNYPGVNCDYSEERPFPCDPVSPLDPESVVPCCSPGACGAISTVRFCIEYWGSVLSDSCADGNCSDCQFVNCCIPPNNNSGPCNAPFGYLTYDAKCSCQICNGQAGTNPPGPGDPSDIGRCCLTDEDGLPYCNAPTTKCACENLNGSFTYDPTATEFDCLNFPVCNCGRPTICYCDSACNGNVCPLCDDLGGCDEGMECCTTIIDVCTTSIPPYCNCA